MGKAGSNKRFAAVVLICSLLVPGSGFVLLGKPARGLMYLVWIVFFGCLTYKLSPAGVSMIGRLSGGIAVWALSVVEVHRMLRRRSAKEAAGSQTAPPDRQSR